MKQTTWEESVFQVKTSLSNCLLIFQFFFFLLGVILGNSGPLDQSKCAVSYHLNTIFGVLQLFFPHPVMMHFPLSSSLSLKQKGRKSAAPQFPRTHLSNINSETADKQLNDRLVPKQFLRRDKILLDFLQDKTACLYLAAVWLLHIN